MIEKIKLKKENERLQRSAQPSISQRRELEQRLDEGHRAYKCLEQDLENLTKEKLEATVNIIRLETEVRGFRDTRTAARVRIGELECALKRSEADNQQCKLHVKRLETDVRALKDMRDIAQDQIDDPQNNLDDAETSLQESEGQVHEKDSAISARDVIIKDLQASLQNYKESFLEEKENSTSLCARLDSFVDAESKLVVMFQQRAGLVVESSPNLRLRLSTHAPSTSSERSGSVDSTEREDAGAKRKRDSEGPEDRIRFQLHRRG